ncbi:MAG: leucyl/phenylalanyl-tRNA--protein transferase [Armatimonadetes bacterium]|nr:leucyl/phenylalanyl-tRNA--protein transferase [Armatimonadota bacterium]
MRRKKKEPPQIIPPQMLLELYAAGYFPMGDDDSEEIRIYSADPRAILPLSPFHVPRRLQRTLRQRNFLCTRDRDFSAVIRACADRESTWINRGIIASYEELHRLGYAHSVEVWEGDALVGGLYGVHLNSIFFGESIFHRVPDAGKAALVHLAGHLENRGIEVLEIQMVTSLTQQFGATLVNAWQYRNFLDRALRRPVLWEDNHPLEPLNVQCRFGLLRLG